jgi:hypothetical protein
MYRFREKRNSLKHSLENAWMNHSGVYKYNMKHLILFLSFFVSRACVVHPSFFSKSQNMIAKWIQMSRFLPLPHLWSRQNINHRMDSPPNIKYRKQYTQLVNEVFVREIVLLIVCLRYVRKSQLVFSPMYSAILSNTTTVSSGNNRLPLDRCNERLIDFHVERH